MDFELKTFDLADACRQKCDALVALVTEDWLDGADPVSRLVQEARKCGDFEPKPGKLLQAWRVDGVAARRVVIAGAGDGSARRVQSAVLAAVAALRNTSIKRLVVAVPAQAAEAAVRATVIAIAEASYAYVATKSKGEGRALDRATIAVPVSVTAHRQAFDVARATAAGVEFARELGNLPPNVATPTRLGEEAKKLSKAHGLRCEVLGPKEVERLGMGSFMAVARGSEEPLRFIVLQYRGAADSQPPVVLVGKGITFDSGGISIKPAPEMDEMKFDMCGAASVLGTFRALGELKPRLNVVGLIPACENLPDGRALKPGDVVTSMSGQTIEVLNTDAEGRLILCDALTYAERFKPRSVVDIATLTGACVIALGAVRSGMFSSDDALARALQEAGDAALDLCWRMPLDDEYADGLKTNFADVANIAGRPAGSITAAKFLQRFAGKYSWAHLDIAGTAWKGGASKGSTGRPVGLLVQYLLSQQDGAVPVPKVGRKKAASR
ncbi:MAG: leucyl aminopeptidase [Ramlibacter sp.]